ncbi:MAG: BrnT family toxin [Acidobacteriota bacterium]|nr:BrnT family toxin [Acidobacteriota bacterium]
MYGIPFEWDRRKESANRRKHDVGFAKASTVFADPLSITISDPNGTSREERFVIVGMSNRRRLLVVVHTNDVCWLWFILIEQSGSACYEETL